MTWITTQKGNKEEKGRETNKQLPHLFVEWPLCHVIVGASQSPE